MSAIGTFRALYVPCQWADSAATAFMANVPSVCSFVGSWYAGASRGRCQVPMEAAPMVKVSQSLAQGYVPSLQYEITTKLAALGYRVADYARIVVVTDRVTALGYKGLCWGTWSWVNCGGSDYEWHASIHELGHSFGLPHAASLNTTEPMANGTLRIAIDCSTPAEPMQFTGDECSAMGYVASRATFSANEQATLGWLTENAPQNGYRTYQGGDQLYTLTPLGQAGGALYAVRIPMAQFRVTSSRIYWIEYRQPVGVDTYPAGGQAGIQLRLVNDYNCAPQCWVSAHNGAYRQQAFAIGEAFTDDLIRMTVVGEGVIRITQVQSGGNTPPAQPSRPLTVGQITWG